MREREEIDRLSARIDAILQGRDPGGADAESRLLRALAGLDLSNESRKRISERRRLLAMMRERNRTGPYGRLINFVARRPVWIGACGLILVACFAGYYFRYMDAPAGGGTLSSSYSPHSGRLVLPGREEAGAAATAGREQGASAGPKTPPSSAQAGRQPEDTGSGSNAPVGTESKALEFGYGGYVDAAPAQDFAGQPYSLRLPANGLLRAAPSPAAQGYLAKSLPGSVQPFHTEEYDYIEESGFKNAVDDPLSTFSIDVDTASYANVRRYLAMGIMPPKDAVRIEEMINYFTYNYPQPTAGRPFSVTMEMAACPWREEHALVLIGLQGRRIDLREAPPNNLVFLLDVSGSMDEPNKLPLLKSSFKLLVGELRPQDTVAIVVYAGAAGLVLPPTSGGEKERILAALEELQAGGSTAGGAGIKLAYRTARQSFIKGGNNRVILATDGDFNVGVSSDAELERLIEKEREDGIFLSVLGFGMGNYKDSKMEKLADRGNGNYAYIDSLAEAKKVLVDQAGGTLLAIAKDVKLQVEFNPAKILSYRLVGYENRALANEDFDNDSKDAGELGAGHAVTALYEVVPNDGRAPQGRELKYQSTTVKGDSEEWLTVKLRYKDPDGTASKLISVPLAGAPKALAGASDDFRFAAAVACFGMLLRDSEHKGRANLDLVLSLARGALGPDIGEYRRGFLELVEDYRRALARIRDAANIR